MRKRARLSPGTALIAAVAVSALLLASPALADDIRNQFPDVGGGAGSGGFNSPGNSSTGNNSAGNNLSRFNPANFFHGNFNPGNLLPGNLIPGNSGRPPFGATAPSPMQSPMQNPIDDASAGTGNFDNSALLNRIYFDPRKMTKPDKYADNPSTDNSGGRHFDNGRHYDLSSTSVKSAVAQLNAADDLIVQQAMQRQQIKQNRGRLPF